MRKTQSGQDAGEEARALGRNHRAWAPRPESLENPVLCIWKASTVPRESQGLRWEWGAGLDPSSPHHSNAQAWAAAGSRDSLGRPIFLVPGPERPPQVILS